MLAMTRDNCGRLQRDSWLVSERRAPLRDDGGGLQLEDERSALDAGQAAAVQGRIAVGEHSCHAVPRWRDPDDIRHDVEVFDQQARRRNCSLHEATAVEAGRSDAPTRLCREVLRPASDEERLAWTRAATSPPAFRSLQGRQPTHAKAEHEKPRSPRRYTWWELLIRSFGIDALVCPECQSRRRLLTWPQTASLQPPAEADRLRIQRPASRVHH
ncbi:MAG: hypothetical protein IPM29_08290 [Planctomycetes bacterium]|nr:hypothetical protein [Planctomycetota bacterium]